MKMNRSPQSEGPMVSVKSSISYRKRVRRKVRLHSVKQSFVQHCCVVASLRQGALVAQARIWNSGL